MNAAPPGQLTQGEIWATTGVGFVGFAVTFAIFWLAARRWHPRWPRPSLPQGGGSRAATPPQSETVPLTLIDEIIAEGADVAAAVAAPAAAPATAHVATPADVMEPFDLSNRANAVSTANSTLHCVVVIPGILFGLWLGAPWGADLWPAHCADPTSLTAAHNTGDCGYGVAPLLAVLCVSFAYFAFDLVVVVGFFVPLWGVFAAHHVLAMVCIGTNLFFPDCRRGATFTISVFLLVEVTTVPLNIHTHALQVGYPDRSRLAQWTYFATAACWVPTRLVIPVAMVVLNFTRVLFPSVPVEHRWCYAPSIAGSVLLTAFCVVVFVGVVVPEVRRRLAGAPPPATALAAPTSPGDRKAE